MKRKQLLLLLVLLMTAVTGAWAQTGMTNGLFSVSPTKRVYFSKGNLQYDGTNWKFAASQWEVLGANGTGAIGTATNYPMDLFTWGNIDSPTYNGATYYAENADLSGITDWGSRMGSGWYTLSKDEWLYLFGMESNNTDKSGHARYRKYFRATVNGVTGIVVLPDDLSGISDIPAESSRGTASNFNGKTYTTDAWSAMESAGCVFLPTAGFRGGTTVIGVGTRGDYWSSTTLNAGNVYDVHFDTSGVLPQSVSNRGYGLSVRLVIDQYYLTLADGVKDADKWTVKVGEGDAQALPIGGLKGDGSETVTLQYNGRLKVKGVKATSDAGAPAAPTGNSVDLSTLEGDYEAKDGDVLTGETTSYKVTIAAGATVTLDGVTISSGGYCIKCLGDATIILKDGSTNTLTSTSTDYPALSIGDTGTTLTIQGNTGVLDVTSGSNCAGIGGGYSNTDHTCGNIRIEGGFITARGGAEAAGIGTDYGPATCGDIIITGGTINATGGQDATGIGAGRGAPGKPSNCGAITITNGVTKVTATKGVCTDLIDCIGAGYNNSSCGTIIIGCTLDTNGNPVGGTKYWENNAPLNGGNTYLAQSPLIYDPTAAAAFAADEYNEASWDDTNKKVVFEKKKATTNPVAVADANTNVTWSDGWYTVSGNVTITGKVTLGADTHLILQDGATLTINGQLDCRTNKKNLYIYGQKKGDGKLNVTNNGAHAINSDTGYRIDIHGGEVTAAATGNRGNGLNTGYLAVYGGKLTATSGGKNGIIFQNTINVYGGEVEATSNATSDAGYGINSVGGLARQILTVYGGKVTATGNGIENFGAYGSGIGCYVMSGTSGIKFYFSEDGTTWDEGTGYASATNLYTIHKRYAKAE